MTEKKKLNESQIWTSVMTILPVVLLMHLGDELTNDSKMRILYAGAFSMIGALIGFTANHLTKDKSRLVKALTSVFITLGCGLTIFFLSSKPTDAEILEKEWITQRIGIVEFESPTRLELRSSEVPDEVTWFYSETKLYSDKETDRVTSFIQSRILIDTLLIEDAYSGALEGMLKKIGVKIENVQLDVFSADKNEVSSMFSFDLNGVRVNGYGFMYLGEKRLESVWLMPLKKGFSKEYIEKFDTGVALRYEYYEE